MEIVDTIVREARVDDASALSVLCSQLGYAVTLDQLNERLPCVLEQTDTAVLVAVDPENRVLGWMQLKETSSLVDGIGAEIIGLVIDERHRRKGIGRQLVSSAREWASGRGHSKLRVRSNAARQGAHDFYPNLGFYLKKTQRCYALELG